MTTYHTVDDYLDALDPLLPGSPRERRRILSEVEDHLSLAIDAHEATGADREAALASAIAAFGSPRTVAQSFANPPGRFATGVGVAFQFVPVAAIGLLAIAFSGLLALAASGPFGQEFISGNSGQVRTEMAHCARLVSEGRVDGCISTELTNRFESTVLLRLIAGAAGVAILLAWVVARFLVRNRNRPATSPRLVPAVATALFGVIVFASAASGLSRLMAERDVYGAGSSLTLAAALLLPLGWYASRLLMPVHREV